jgi:hypothetical protein
MDYRVCEADDVVKLQEQVNQMTREGWPIGGIVRHGGFKVGEVATYFRPDPTRSVR